MEVGNFISGSSAFSKPSLNIWKFTVQVLLKPGLENFEHCFARVLDECSCAVVLGTSNFLEEISRLSNSVVFLYFFALITEEGFLISPC